METWLPVVDRRGKLVTGYEVSSLGRVRSYWGHGPRVQWLAKPRLRKVSLTKPREGRQPTAVMCLKTGKGGKSYTFQVHELVAWAFLGRPGRSWVIVHLNDDGQDNRLVNLAWVSRSEAALRSVEKRPRRPLAKLTEAKVRLIRRSTKTARELAEQLGVQKRAVYDVRWGRTWRDVV